MNPVHASAAPSRPLNIGLTGGIGSGKSTVASRLQQLGAAVIDADAISRALTAADGAAIEPIRAHFGAEAIAPDGAMNRAHMRALVFNDPSVKARLEALLHPLIALECNRQALAAGDRTRVFDVPLLVESAHWRRRVDRVLVVDCSESRQIERVMARSGWSPAMVQAVIAQQATRATRRMAADAVIFNDGISLDALAVEVDAVWRHWTHEASPLPQAA